MPLLFDEQKHKYTLDGVELPGVTKVIGEIFPISDFISRELLEETQKLGKQIHKTTELYDANKLDEAHPLLLRYLDSWIKFKKDYDFEVINIELMGYHPLYKYAFRLDRIGNTNFGKTLIDIKSGTKQKTHAYQTAAYKAGYDYGLDKKLQIKKRLTVYLSETGYEVEPNNKETDINIFLACLTIYNAKRSK